MAGHECFSSGGSNYSVFGIGDLMGATGAYYQGLGGTSIAIPSNGAINTKNPALWSLVTSTKLQVGYRFSQYYVEQGKSELFQNNGSIDVIAGLLCIDTSLGLTISFGLSPYSHVDYLNTGSFKVVVDTMEVQGSTLYSGKGGLSNAYVGASVSPFKGLSVGLSAFANIGSVATYLITETYDETAIGTATLKDDNYTGSGIRGGLYYTFEGLGLGVFYEKQLNMKASTRLRYYYNYDDLDTTIEYSTPYTLPDSYGFGLSYRTGKFLFGADLTMQDYSNYKYQLSPKFKFKDYMNVSLGVSRLGSELTGAKYPDKVTYNFGLGYKQLNYSVLNSEGKFTDIDEIYGSFGMSMPVVNSTTFDWSLTVGSRGTTKNGLVHEIYAQMFFNVSIGETWFKPFKRSYEE